MDTEVMLDRKTIASDARAFAGDLDLAGPEISPLFADLSRLPPTLVQAGGRDMQSPVSDTTDGRSHGHDGEAISIPGTHRPQSRVGAMPDGRPPIEAESDNTSTRRVPGATEPP